MTARILARIVAVTVSVTSGLYLGATAGGLLFLHCYGLTG